MAEYLTDTDREAEALCHQGIEVCEQQKQLEEAHQLFLKANDLAGYIPRVQSWLGYTTVLVEKKTQKGFLLCRQAVDSQVPDPYFYRNIGVVFIVMNNRKAAIGAFAKGLQVDKDHQAIRNAWLQLGVRRSPPLNFLSRTHPMNKFLGKLTWKLLKPQFKPTI